jgi:hypothetical protein
MNWDKLPGEMLKKVAAGRGIAIERLKRKRKGQSVTRTEEPCVELIYHPSWAMGGYLRCDRKHGHKESHRLEVADADGNIIIVTWRIKSA